MQNLSYENEYNLHGKEHVGGTHFDITDGFARILVMIQR